MVVHTDTVTEVGWMTQSFFDQMNNSYKFNLNLFQITATVMIMGTVMAEKEKEGVRSCRC